MSFNYPGTDVEVLRHLDLSIPVGQSLAIVGTNGAGKTTLIKLLCRLYEPTDGHIALGELDLRDLDPVAWRRGIAVIFQDFVRYELSAADNVGLGAVERRRDRALLERSAQRAGADDLIAGLPHGWDTVLSRQYSNGSDISGGEWQRVAIARALGALEAGSRVLVLDEPTAHLDVRAEAAVLRSLPGAHEGRDDDPDLPSLLDGTKGRCHLCARRRPCRGAWHP